MRETTNICFEGYFPGKEEYQAETLLTVGNGYLALRGTTPEMEISKETYPATYSASLYNTLFSDVENHMVKNEDFVNAPDFQKMYLVIDDVKVNPTETTLVSLKRKVNLKNGLFEAKAVYRLPNGKEIQINTEKFVSMANRHEYFIKYQVTPLNFSGSGVLVSEGDGAVYNYNVTRYRSLENHHLEILEKKSSNQEISLLARTTQSKISIYQKSKLTSQDIALKNLTIEETDKKISQKVNLDLVEKKSLTFEKVVFFAQWRQGEEEIDFENKNFLSFDEAFEASEKEWSSLLEKVAIKIEGDDFSQKLLNLHNYHLLVSASPKGNQNIDASVTARGLHGEAYRGHIFWDELFIFPFYFLHFPQTARQLLMYRYLRLEKAKENAKKAGFKGAMFPWQSGLVGTEETQERHLNPLSGQWKEDNSQRQRHVSLAIAYNVWSYYHHTLDEEFMTSYGLEMILEIAHFWQSLATFNEKTGRYDIKGVMGPDEFHEGYPNAEVGGITNNAYTNLMVTWLFTIVEKLQKKWPVDFERIQEKVQLTTEELQEIEKISRHLALEINEEGIIAQYQGFLDLKELDWDAYKEKYGNIYRLDRILNAEGKSADEYQVLKQADSLMIYFNLPKEEVEYLIKRLGYSLPADYLSKNLTYYLNRTSHGSTLSRVVHAYLAGEMKKEELGWQLYQEALQSDYIDIQGGTTAEGVHTGVMAATRMLPVTTYAGIDFRGEMLRIQPHLPKKWQSLQFTFQHQGITYHMHLAKNWIKLKASEDVSMMIFEEKVSLKKNQQQVFLYNLTEKIKGFVFDLDGVITDTAKYHFQAWRQLANKIGIDFDEAFNENLKGVSRMESLEKILSHGGKEQEFSEDEKLALAAEKNQLYLSLLEQLTPEDLLPGIESFLEKAKEQNLPCVVASASKNAPYILEKLGVKDQFFGIVDPETLTKGKPDPEIFIKAAEMMSLKPEETMGFEDAPAGVEGMKKSGMYTIAITENTDLKGDLLIKDLSELNFLEW